MQCCWLLVAGRSMRMVSWHEQLHAAGVLEPLPCPTCLCPLAQHPLPFAPRAAWRTMGAATRLSSLKRTLLRRWPRWAATKRGCMPRSEGRRGRGSSWGLQGAAHQPVGGEVAKRHDATSWVAAACPSQRFSAAECRCPCLQQLQLTGCFLFHPVPARRWVPFVCELAVMVVRSRDGSVASFPVVQVGEGVTACSSRRHAAACALWATCRPAWTCLPARLPPSAQCCCWLPTPTPLQLQQTIHKDSICWTTETPARVPVAAQRRAQEVAEQAISALEGGGKGLVVGLEWQGSRLPGQLACLSVQPSAPASHRRFPLLLPLLTSLLFICSAPPPCHAWACLMWRRF